MCMQSAKCMAMLCTIVFDVCTRVAHNFALVWLRFCAYALIDLGSLYRLHVVCSHQSVCEFVINKNTFGKGVKTVSCRTPKKTGTKPRKSSICHTPRRTVLSSIILVLNLTRKKKLNTPTILLMPWKPKKCCIISLLTTVLTVAKKFLDQSNRHSKLVSRVSSNHRATVAWQASTVHPTERKRKLRTQSDGADAIGH